MYEVGYTPVTVGREMCECVIAGQTVVPPPPRATVIFKCAHVERSII